MVINDCYYAIIYTRGIYLQTTQGNKKTTHLRQQKKQQQPPDRHKRAGNCLKSGEIAITTTDKRQLVSAAKTKANRQHTSLGATPP
jgi:hypothetical protein